MFCDKCGQEVKENCKFCPNCGNEIQKVTERKKEEHKKLKGGILGIATILVIIALVLVGKNMRNLSSVENNEQKESKIVEDVEEDVLEDAEQYYACVQDENGKYGFIDEFGNEVIQCQYDSVGDFSWFGNTLAPVGKIMGEAEDGTVLYEWGFIDKTGEIIIPYQFDGVGEVSVSDNLAPVVKRENIDGTVAYKWGFIDRTGALAIPYEYTNFLHDYNSTVLDNENLIPVQKEFDINGETEYRWGFINEKNETVIEFLYDIVTPFSKEGLAAAEKDGLCGYINREGKVVIPFKFLTAGTSGKNGKAIVTDENNKEGIVDKNGEIVNFLENQRDYTVFIGDFFMENGLSRIWKEEGETYYAGLVDENGREIVSCECQDIKDPDINGYMTVSKKVGNDILYGLMNSEGEMVIPLQYNYMSGFGDNGWSLAGVRRAGSDGEHEKYDCKYIDKDNQVVLDLPDKYINAWAFIKVN